MIRINIQTFAKSAAWQSDRRKSKAIERAKQEEGDVKERIKEEKAAKAKRAKGDAVSAVKANEQYQVFYFEGNKEVPYTDKAGNPVYRTGAEIANKMIYNKNREGWESKAQLKNQSSFGLGKVRRYIIRKRK